MNLIPIINRLRGNPRDNYAKLKYVIIKLERVFRKRTRKQTSITAGGPFFKLAIDHETLSCNTEYYIYSYIYNMLYNTAYVIIILLLTYHAKNQKF